MNNVVSAALDSQHVIPAQQMLPRKPKRALNHYNLFFQHKRAEIIAEFNRANGNDKTSHFKGLACEVSRQWKNVSEEEMAYFVELAAQDKARHAREMKIWKQQQELIQAMKEESRIRQQEQQDPPFEESSLEECEPFPFFSVETPTPSFSFNDNSALVSPERIQNLAASLGEDCVDMFIRAFRHSNGLDE